MTFTIEEARKEVQKAKLRKEQERQEEREEERKLFQKQRLDAKKDLPWRMEELLGWIKEMANKALVEGTYSGWRHYGGQGAYYKMLVTLAVKELVDLDFVASDKLMVQSEACPSDGVLENVYTYPIYINWS